MKDIYWTLGAYDVVPIMEAPDEKTAAACAFGSPSNEPGQDGEVILWAMQHKHPASMRTPGVAMKIGWPPNRGDKHLACRPRTLDSWMATVMSKPA
jgi:hypothetical protein